MQWAGCNGQENKWGFEKMKIAFDGQLLLNEERTGIAWNTHNLVLELLKYPENTCTLQCFREGRTDIQIDSRLNVYRKAGCRIECCGRISHTLYKLLWVVFPVPYRLFFRTKADITQFFNYAVPPGVYGKRVTFFHDMAYRSCPHTVSRRTELWLWLCMKRSCRHADHIVTVSAFSKSEILKYLKVKEAQVTVIPCAVDHTIFHPGYPKEQIRKACKKYHIRQEYFLYMGTIEPRKNLERLIGAYARLCRRYKNVPQLVLAGKKGWLCGGIYEKVRELGLEHRVLFPGYIAQEDSPLLLCGAKAFLFPSLYEGFGIPPLEAMACATPVVVSHTASLPEVAGDAGLLVNPESEAEICHAMDRMLHDPECRERLRKAGIERAREYTWEKSAAMLMEVYRKLKPEP